MSNNEEIVSKAAGDSCQLNDEIAKEEPKAKSQTPKVRFLYIYLKI